MRLYPKKLRGIEDLEQEKKLLVARAHELEEEEFHFVEGFLGKKASKKKDKGKNRGDEDDNNQGSLLDYLDLLPISNPLIKTGIKMAIGRIARWQAGSSGNKKQRSEGTEKKGRSPLRAIAVEVIGGYLKWKAIEMAYKGIRHLLKKRKDAREVNRS